MPKILSKKEMKIVLENLKIIKKGNFMIKVGEHITYDFLGVKKRLFTRVLRKSYLQNSKSCKGRNIKRCFHKFEPQGFTLVALLSESHFSFHTFPERGVISFDFFTCGKVNLKLPLKF